MFDDPYDNAHCEEQLVSTRLAEATSLQSECNVSPKILKPLSCKTGTSVFKVAGITHRSARMESSATALFPVIARFVREFKKRPSRRQLKNFDPRRVHFRWDRIDAQLKRFFSLGSLQIWLDEFPDIFFHIVDVLNEVKNNQRDDWATRKFIAPIGVCGRDLQSFEKSSSTEAYAVDYATRLLFSRHEVAEVYLLTCNVPGDSERAYISVCFCADFATEKLVELVGEVLGIKLRDFVGVWEYDEEHTLLHFHIYIHVPHSVPMLLESQLADCWHELLREIHSLTNVSPFRMEAGGELPVELLNVDITQWKIFKFWKDWTYLANPYKQKKPRSLEILGGQSLSPRSWSLISKSLQANKGEQNNAD